MKNPAKIILSASKKVIASRGDAVIFSLLSIGLWLLFVYVPIWTTPGDDFLFHLLITPPETHALMIALALLNALLLMMHLHIRRQHHARIGAASGAHSLGSLVSALVATIGCASCYSSIISIFGLGAVTFVGEYRWLISLIALGITLTALYLTANRIENGCKVCRV